MKNKKNTTNIFLLFIIFIALSIGCKKQETTKELTLKKPNIIFILADDMGYSDISSYGSEIQTPNIDLLANSGTVFTNFYNSSRCSPSRASLLTGQYPHQVGMGLLAKEEKGKPGPYQGYLSKVPTIASELKKEDYKTYMVGKWHLGQEKENWPLQYGFDRYFGLLSGASSYFELITYQPKKRLMANNNELWTPKTKDFYMTTAISDTAVSYINQHKKDKPFFMYLSYTAPHWPLHALAEDIELFNNVYEEGWDKLIAERYERMLKLGIIDDSKLPSKPNNIPDWDSLSNQEQKRWSKLMKVYAAMVYRMDVGIGKIINKLKAEGLYDNTIIMFASDNGADKSDVSKRRRLDDNGNLTGRLNDNTIEPGAKGSYLSYLEPWARLSNTPYIDYKKSAYWGGMRTPFILFDGRNIETNTQIVNHNAHFIDVLPTILEYTKTEIENKNTEGISFAKIKDNNKNINLYDRPIFFEHEGSKAVITKEWKLLKERKEQHWQLFNLKKDPFETKDIASQNTTIVTNLVELYLKWEKRTNSYTHKNISK